MNKDDLMKWLLIAGAAYLVYRFLQAQAQAKAKAAEVGETPPAKELPPADKVPDKPAGFAEVKRDALIAFAKGRMGEGWEGLLTISQWNWMVSQMTKVEQQTDLSFGEDVTNPVSVDDYLARRARAGISGLEQAFGRAYRPPMGGWA